MKFNTVIGLSEHAIISSKATIGNNVKVGPFSVIDADAVIGDDVVIGSHARIKAQTIIEPNVFIDDHVISSGYCRIGEGSQIRYQSIIARNVSIGKNVFFCAGVKTAYLDHSRNGSNTWLVIGDNCFVGDNATILAGLELAEGVVIGAHSLVTANCHNHYGVYVGTPARFLRPLTDEERKLSRR